MIRLEPSSSVHLDVVTGQRTKDASQYHPQGTMKQMSSDMIGLSWFHVWQHPAPIERASCRGIAGPPSGISGRGIGCGRIGYAAGGTCSTVLLAEQRSFHRQGGITDGMIIVVWWLNAMQSILASYSRICQPR